MGSSGALRLKRDGLPLLPALQPLRVIGLRDPEGRGAEENAERRLLRVDDLEERVRRGLGIALLADARFALLLDLLAELGVFGHLLRAFGRRSTPVGVEAARLDQGDVNDEVRDLLGERLGEPFERPLRRVVRTDARERGDPADRRDLQDVPALLLP